MASTADLGERGQSQESVSGAHKATRIARTSLRSLFSFFFYPFSLVPTVFPFSLFEAAHCDLSFLVTGIRTFSFPIFILFLFSLIFGSLPLLSSLPLFLLALSACKNTCMQSIPPLEPNNADRRVRLPPGWGNPFQQASSPAPAFSLVWSGLVLH